jgi:predicted metal-dependent enzyme (double-stranded beta helix superfamily)
MANNRHLVFEKFIQDLRAAWAEVPDLESRMKKTAQLLERLVRNSTLREHSKNWPSTDGHKNLLLYEDPEYGFVINAVVRVSGAQGRAHDHAIAWTAYGVLDGKEKMERFRCLEDRRSEGYAKIELESVTEGSAGKVDLVPPFEVHSEKGALDGRSVAVIVRSERLVGRALQGRYDLATGKYFQGEGPTQVPFEIV